MCACPFVSPRISETKGLHQGEGYVFNATFINISAIYVAVSFIGKGNRSTRRNPSTCRKSHSVISSLPSPNGII